MRLKKLYFTLTILFITMFSFTFGIGNVSANSAITTSEYSRASIWKTLDGKNDMPYGNTRFSEGILGIDGRFAYCVDATKGFKKDKVMESKDAVSYFEDKVRNKTTAQEIVTRLALYDKFLLEERPTLNKEQRYFFGQVLIWNALREYLGWAPSYWVETWKGGNIRLFPNQGSGCNTVGTACENANAKFEQDLYADAENYYQGNKTKFKGEGTVWDNGVNQPLAEFTTKKINRYDYYIDAACDNCDSKTTKGSYYIQDIIDWEAIINSRSSENDNVKSYYIKDEGRNIYCREEYKVVLPNANNLVSVTPGRYFTVNKDSVTQDGVSNFGPIRVEKIRQCRSTSGNQKENIDNFLKQYGTGDSGDVKITYKEKIRENTYTIENKKLKVKKSKEKCDGTSTSNVEGSTYIGTCSATYNYELPENTNIYIKLQNGQSVSNKPNEAYYNAGIANLPISFKNYSTDEVTNGATISIDYDLPTNDINSKMHKATTPNNKDNNYLRTGNAEGNIYKKGENLEESACGKLYGKGYSFANSYNTEGNCEVLGNEISDEVNAETNEKYNQCVADRTENAAGKSTDRNENCIEKLNGAKFTCEINACKEGEKVCTNGLCSVDGKCDTSISDDSDDKGNNNYSKNIGEYTNSCTCKIENGNYYGKYGQKITGDNIEESTVEAQYQKECGCYIKNIGTDTKYYVKGEEKSYAEYKPICGCRIENGKYYNDLNIERSKSQYEEECICANCKGGICCPDTDMVCPDENGECPGKGGNKIIYRPIDLTNSFPGQTNYQRATGANWCSYNTKTGKTTCKNTNSVVINQIKENREVDNENVYGLTPLYEVELNATNIRKIRSKYNNDSDKSYEDFTLTCKDGTCMSNFLRDNELDLQLTGVCGSINNVVDLKRCEERRQ